MRSIYKNIKLIALLLAGSVMASSCKKYLDLVPKNAIPDELAVVDKKSAEQVLRGVYRAFGSASQSYITLMLFAGGDATFNNVGDPHLVISHEYRSDNSTIAAPWAAYYKAINQANLVIEKVPGLTDVTLTEADRKQLIGEALFIRAFSYFNLVRVWGGVPLKLKPTTDLSEPLGIQRSSLAESYAQIEADLTAAGNLVSTTGANRIRVSKPAIQALWTRLYLYQQKWVQAEESANLLIGNTNYTLLKPFTAWSKADLGTKESILEIAYTTQTPNGLRNTFQHQTKGGTYSIAPKAATSAALENVAIGGGPTGRRSLIGSVVQAGTTIWYGDLYYRTPATDPVYLLRIAEQYLIRAEARVKRDKLGDALADINLVRDRANLPAFTSSDFDITDPAELLKRIENERRFEFLWEGDRWPDLVRTGSAKTLFALEDYKLLLPIPLDEVVIGKLQQNPKYN